MRAVLGGKHAPWWPASIARDMSVCKAASVIGMLSCRRLASGRMVDKQLTGLRWLLQEMTLSMDVARHFAEALTLLRRQESNPVDPATLAGSDVQTVMHLNDVRPRVLNALLYTQRVRASAFGQHVDAIAVISRSGGPSLGDRRPVKQEFAMGEEWGSSTDTVACLRRGLAILSAGVHAVCDQFAGDRRGSGLGGRSAAFASDGGTSAGVLAMFLPACSTSTCPSSETVRGCDVL